MKCEYCDKEGTNSFPAIEGKKIYTCEGHLVTFYNERHKQTKKNQFTIEFWIAIGCGMIGFLFVMAGGAYILHHLSQFLHH